MRKILIEWKHYDKQGETCTRCSNTGNSIRSVMAVVSDDPDYADISIEYRETRLEAEQMSESNTIYINGRALEDILAATVSENYCHSCTCLSGKGSNCRTIELDGDSHEAIPEELILKALKLVCS